MASLLSSSSHYSVFFTANPKLPLFSPLPTTSIPPFLSFNLSHKEFGALRFPLPSPELFSLTTHLPTTMTPPVLSRRSPISGARKPSRGSDSSFTRFSEFDPPKEDDKWGGNGYADEGQTSKSFLVEKVFSSKEV